MNFTSKDDKQEQKPMLSDNLVSLCPRKHKVKIRSQPSYENFVQRVEFHILQQLYKYSSWMTGDRTDTIHSILVLWQEMQCSQNGIFSNTPAIRMSRQKAKKLWYPIIVLPQSELLQYPEVNHNDEEFDLLRWDLHLCIKSCGRNGIVFVPDMFLPPKTKSDCAVPMKPKFDRGPGPLLEEQLTLVRNTIEMQKFKRIGSSKSKCKQEEIDELSFE